MPLNRQNKKRNKAKGMGSAEAGVSPCYKSGGRDRMCAPRGRLTGDI